MSWTHTARTFTEHLSAPAGAVSQVAVPVSGAAATVTVNGRTVWNGRRSLADGAHLDGTTVALTGVPGHATITSSGN